MSLISAGGAVVGAGGAAAYEIERSLRFNSADSAYLNRTPSGAGNRKTFTISTWCKISSVGSAMYLISANTASNFSNAFGLSFGSGTIAISGTVSDATTINLETTSVYRDPSAWYHIVLSVDTTQATSSNRIKLYVNGVQVTAFSSSTYPSQNADLQMNNSVVTYIGRLGYTSSVMLNGYLTEFHSIDGSALDPSSFGEFNSDTGVWQPIEYTGTYGTNGFYLPFSDNASTTTLGDDFSGNNNDWTTNNFSVTAGAGNDSLVDSPTRYGTDTGAGGEVRGNYCTLNPLNLPKGGSISNGNLLWTTPSAEGQAVGTMYVSSGKYYWEIVQNVSGGGAVGIASITTDINNVSLTAGSYVYYNTDGNKYNGGVGSAYGATWTNDDVIGVALDLDAGTLVFYKNNASQGTAFTGLSGNFTPLIYDGTSAATPTYTANFGQRPFAYTAPSGFKALVTTNLPTPTIEAGNEYFNAVTFNGNGSTNAIAVGFAPDFAWVKARSDAYSHNLSDIIRGNSSYLVSNSTAAETTIYSNICVFGSNGVTLSADSSANVNGTTNVGWFWKANGAGVSNTAGTITSTVSANTTSGFSIVRFTGTDAVATVGHGLGAVPKFMILKGTQRSDWWGVYHVSLGNTKYLQLNTTSAELTSSTVWNDTTPTSTVFTVADQSAINPNGELSIAYVFAEVPGYSAFGSYTGNGSANGPFLYMGFRPSFILWKRTDTTSNWIIHDNKRDPYNLCVNVLSPNVSNAETTANRGDIVSNGFKLGGTGTATNASGGTYIYAAFAENPFSIALAR